MKIRTKHKRITSMLTAIVLLLSTTIMASADYTNFPPKGYGRYHTYTIWDGINWGGDCRQLINYGRANDLISDSYGIVTYGGYFATATTTTLGQVGDLLLVVEEGGIVYPVIIQDIKSQRDYGCNAWGHLNGGCMIEFEILSSMRWSLYHGSGSWISEQINRPIYKVINLGSIYSGNDYYFKNIKQACIDYGLSGYYLLTSPYDGEYV